MTCLFFLMLCKKTMEETTEFELLADAPRSNLLSRRASKTPMHGGQAREHVVERRRASSGEGACLSLSLKMLRCGRFELAAASVSEASFCLCVAVAPQLQLMLFPVRERKSEPKKRSKIFRSKKIIFLFSQRPRDLDVDVGHRFVFSRVGGDFGGFL